METDRLRKAIREVIEATPAEGAPVINLVRRAKRGIKGEGQNLGVFPASFDPLTKAHAAIIREARKQGLDEILLLTDKQNADKTGFGASLEDRVLLVSLFFKDETDISIGISSHGLFLEKLKALEQWYPRDTKIHFVVGYDTILRVLDQKYYDDREAALDKLFKGSLFLVAGRGKEGEQGIRALFDRDENRKFSDRIETLDITPFASISATKARARMRKGEPLEPLVPQEISSLVQELYGRE